MPFLKNPFKKYIYEKWPDVIWNSVFDQDTELRTAFCKPFIFVFAKGSLHKLLKLTFYALNKCGF